MNNSLAEMFFIAATLFLIVAIVLIPQYIVAKRRAGKEYLNNEKTELTVLSILLPIVIIVTVSFFLIGVGLTADNGRRTNGDSSFECDMVSKKCYVVITRQSVESINNGKQ